jgi:hypothetical protein
MLDKNCTDLLNFINAAKAQGASDEFLLRLLEERGWPPDQVFAAFSRRYEALGGVPLPERRSSGEKAKEAFYYLLTFTTLATWAFSAGWLLFALIEAKLPDPATLTDDWRRQAERFGISINVALVLIAFPVFLFVSRLVGKEVRADPERLESPVRKWLTYIALLIAAAIVIGDVATALAFFLRGDLTLRFVMKALVLLVLAGGILVYYLHGLRSTPENPAPAWTGAPLGAAVAIALTLVVMAGFWMLGTPAHQRELSLDERRVQDLRGIATHIHLRWVRAGVGERALPAALLELRPAPGGGRLVMHDPATGRPYTYRVRSESKYQLCASFQTDQRRSPRGEEFWNHAAGEHCYDLDAAVSP